MLDGGSREQVREGFSYYTGLESSRVPRSSSQRRAFIILNGVQDSASHSPWEHLYFSQSYTSSVTSEVLGIINSVMPGDGSGGGGGDGVTFSSWATDNGLPEGASPTNDADGDGLSNAVEFYLGTSPMSPDAQPFKINRLSGSQVAINFPVGQDREGVTAILESSANLNAWSEMAVPTEDWVITQGETQDAAAITIPIDATGFLRLSVRVE